MPRHSNSQHFGAGRLSSKFTLRTSLATSPSAAFNLARVRDTHIATMGRSSKKATAGLMTGQIGPGEFFTRRARHLGLWFSLTVRITDCRRPDAFVDEQVSGPSRAFRHEHRFADDGRGGTLMIGTVKVTSLVFWVIAERLILVPSLRRLIARRNMQLAAI